MTHELVSPYHPSPIETTTTPPTQPFLDAPHPAAYNPRVCGNTAQIKPEVVKTFLIDIPVMMLFGGLFAVLEGPDTRRSIFASSYFWHGLVFTTVFNVAVVYAIRFYPDWMWMYFLPDSHNTKAELIYIFAFLYYLPYALGFYLGYDLKRIGLFLWMIFMLALVGAEVWIVSHLFNRYSVVGTNEEFLQGTAVSLFSPQNPMGPVMNGSVVVMVLYFIGVLFLSRRRKRSGLSV